jgi:hypothetical protein
MSANMKAGQTTEKPAVPWDRATLGVLIAGRPILESSVSGGKSVLSLVSIRVALTRVDQTS